jgi:xylan 1,4-beta-xylosidase
MVFKYVLCLPLLLISFLQEAQPTYIKINAARTIGPMTPFWSYFGYDEPNYTYTHDGKKLLTELQSLSYTPVHVRTHNLLSSKGNSTGPDLKWGYTNVYQQDASGKANYTWTILDSITDTYVHLGIKPLMEIGFMPKDLSIHPEPYDHHWSLGGNIWTGWTYPPKDYNAWKELIFQWVKHEIGRYGKNEVTTWLWEVWNEPDIGYWSGTLVEYLKLYDYAADGLKQACPECKIGGPHTTSPRNPRAYDYLIQFIDHCLHGMNNATGHTGAPLDYIGFHAKGSPEFIDKHIRMNLGAQLKDIAKGFEAVKAFPEIESIPVIIGECDPEGCAACSEKRDPKYGYRNGTMYSSYTAASFARIYELADLYHINLQGAVSWSFEFENQKWYAGFRDLATHGVDKPALNVFRMFGMMQGQRLEVVADHGLTAKDIIATGVRQQEDISALASKSDKSIDIMVWNYHDDDLPANSSSIQITIAGLPGKQIKYTQYRIDQLHSNSFEKWKAMGEPQRINSLQYSILEKSGQLEMAGKTKVMKLENGSLNINIALPRQGVSLIKISL